MVAYLVARARKRVDVDVSHLTLFDEVMDGPLQRDEALMLYGLTRTVRPATVVEVGFLRGHSAFNFLRAMDDDARLYSFDIDPAARWHAEQTCGSDSRFKLAIKSQDEVTSGDIDGRQADLVFLDASHELGLNQRTFERLVTLMSDRAILAVHDTGAVPRRFMEAIDHWALAVPELWVDDECEVMPDERAFVNWILEEHPEFSQIHLHSERAGRCGTTLLQRSAPLPRPARA